MDVWKFYFCLYLKVFMIKKFRICKKNIDFKGLKYTGKWNEHVSKSLYTMCPNFREKIRKYCKLIVTERFLGARHCFRYAICSIVRVGRSEQEEEPLGKESLEMLPTDCRRCPLIVSTAN